MSYAIGTWKETIELREPLPGFLEPGSIVHLWGGSRAGQEYEILSISLDRLALSVGLTRSARHIVDRQNK